MSDKLLEMKAVINAIKKDESCILLYVTKNDNAFFINGYDDASFIGTLELTKFFHLQRRRNEQ